MSEWAGSSKSPFRETTVVKAPPLPAAVIPQAVWLYFRFSLSLRDVEELMAARGIDVSYETIRCWTSKFGPQIARRPKKLRPPLHPAGTWTRWVVPAEASGCSCGAPSTRKARSRPRRPAATGHGGSPEAIEAIAAKSACRSGEDRDRRPWILPSGAGSASVSGTCIHPVG